MSNTQRKKLDRNLKLYIHNILNEICNETQPEVDRIRGIIKLQTCRTSGKPGKLEVKTDSGMIDVCSILNDDIYLDVYGKHRDVQSRILEGVLNGKHKVTIKAPNLSEDIKDDEADYHYRNKYLLFKEIYNGLVYYNKLAEMVPTFIKTHGLWVCKPSKAANCRGGSGSGSEFFMITERLPTIGINGLHTKINQGYDHKENTEKFTSIMVSCLKQLMVALGLLEEQYGMSHNGLHLHNIYLLEDAEAKKWQVNVWGKQVTVKPKGWVVKIGNYSRSCGEKGEYDRRLGSKFTDETEFLELSMNEDSIARLLSTIAGFDYFDQDVFDEYDAKKFTSKSVYEYLSNKYH
jgi:hypothetical protein